MATFKVRYLPTLEDERRMKIEAIKREAHALLAPTDWMLIRAAETGKPVPQAVLDWRAAVRAAADKAEADIVALDSIEAVRVYEVKWPSKPDGL